MYTLATKQWIRAAALAAVMGYATLNAGAAYAKDADMTHDADIDKAVQSTLDECRNVAKSCAEATKDAPGILVFPKVTKADLIIGGAGGEGGAGGKWQDYRIL